MHSFAQQRRRGHKISNPAVGGGESPDQQLACGFKCFRPSAFLADVVEEIWDLDLPDSAKAEQFTITAWASSGPVMLFQYRASLECERQFKAVTERHPPWRHIAIQHHTGVARMRPYGPLGVVIICLKPQAANRILYAATREFLDAKINLCDVFRAGAVLSLENALAEAESSAVQIALIERFLVDHMRERTSGSVLECAMSSLLRNPSLPIWQLANQLEISERQLSRYFQAVLGMRPKQFARIAKLENAIAERRRGGSWVQAAYAAGFTDQSGFIRDFGTVLGSSPEKVFCMSSAPVWADAWAVKTPFFSGLS